MATGYPFNGNNNGNGGGANFAAALLRNWQVVVALVTYLFTMGMVYQSIQDMRTRQDKSEQQADYRYNGIHKEIEDLRSDMEHRYDVIFDSFIKK